MKITTKSTTSTKAVRSKRIAWLLRKDGYKILTVQPDRNHPEKDVYIFENVTGFTEALSKYITETTKRKEK